MCARISESKNLGHYACACVIMNTSNTHVHIHIIRTIVVCVRCVTRYIFTTLALSVCVCVVSLSSVCLRAIHAHESRRDEGQCPSGKPSPARPA